MKKTTIVTLSILILASVLGLSAITDARANGNKFFSSMMGMGYYKNVGQMMNEMKGRIFNGFAKNGSIVGEVSSVGSSILKIDVRNREYTVNVDIVNDIIVNRVWDKINLSDIKVGDTVNVVGTKTDTTIDAKLVRDLSIPPFTEITINGKVTAVSSSTIAVAVNNGSGTSYTVNIEVGDILVNRIWDKINILDIKVNDKVMVYGTVSSTTINAKLVKNLSLPLVSTTEDDED